MIDDDILKEIENLNPKSRIFFNIFNVHYQAIEEDIANYFEEVEINKIIALKPGSFGISVIGREEAMKLVEKSTGVNNSI